MSNLLWIFDSVLLVLPLGWTYSSDVGTRFKSVNGGFNSPVLALDIEGYPYVNDGSNWRKISNEVFTNISPGKTGTWAITRKGRVLKGSILSRKTQEMIWIPQSVNSVIMLESGYSDFVTGIDSSSVLLLRNGDDSPFTKYNAEVQYVTAGAYGIWYLDKDGDVFFSRYWKETDGIRFDKIPGKFKQIDTGRHNEVYGIKKNGSVYRRHGVSGRNPTGSTWIFLSDTNLKSISSGNDGIYGVNQDGQIIRKDG